MLVVLDPSAPLTDALLLQHRHQLLMIHLPGLDQSINRAAETCISETVGEVVHYAQQWSSVSDDVVYV